MEHLVIDTKEKNEPSLEDQEKHVDIRIEKQRFDAAKGVVLTGWILLMITCVGIILANVYMWLNGLEVPETLSNWGSAVIGFLFGSFITLLKEFITDKD